jgi:type III secretory pathway component EscU
LAWTKSMLTGTWYYNRPFVQVLNIFSIYSVVELLEYILLAITFIPVLTHSLTLSALSQTVHTLPSVGLILQHLPTIHSPLSSQVITSNFSSIPIVFHTFFLDCTTWCSLTHVGKKSQYYWW